MIKVFIDGQAGTTGLQLKNKLMNHPYVKLIEIDEEKRKDVEERRRLMNESDVVFLCLPDSAAVEAVKLVENPDTVIIDASTAHRTDGEWTYGFPELSNNHYDKIKKSKRIANPGCHASGFIALIKPLVESGVINRETALNCFSVTGYSGGGKKMIADYETANKSALLKAPRQYGLSQQHKHLKEMQIISGIDIPPAFCPVVADFYSGMEVTVTLFKKDITADISHIKEIYKNYYTGKLVHFDENADEGGFLSAAAFSGKDDMQISVYGNSERILLTARYDNLGKGASGAAIQNMNILMGVDETTGLVY